MIPCSVKMACFLCIQNEIQAVCSYSEEKVYNDGTNDLARKWEVLGFMGPNFLYNDDGIVFNTPMARSYQSGGGSESGTIILKKEDGKIFLQILNFLIIHICF